jgi:ABC-type hemin transport system ATPase subunit
VQRVILLRGGRILADGPAAANLTAARLSELFDFPVAVDVSEGYHYARPTEGSALA